MFSKFRVITMTKNVEGGEATFKEEKDTKKQALDLYYKNLNDYGSNEVVACVEVVVFNLEGGIEKIEKRDNENL